MAYGIVLLCISCIIVSASAKEKRELPLSFNCNPSINDSCVKGDLIDTSIADCKKDRWYRFNCNPVNNSRYPFSSIVDVPDTSGWNVADCVPDYDKPMVCGATNDTRCVCDSPFDINRIQFDTCRCQYWPTIDERSNEPSYCTQYDHGGTSGIHFFICCNNCDDDDNFTCNATTYQGGGSTDDYCGPCGLSSKEGGGRITYRFNCVSCEQQRKCEEYCDKRWFGLTAVVPGLCPQWAGCFRKCCIAAASEPEFCGDLECKNCEDSWNCPIDCCPRDDPQYCQPGSTRSCCTQPGCCSQ